MSYLRTPVLLVLCLILFPLSAMAASNAQIQPFIAKDLDGNTINLSQYIGKNPIMLVFWASWCPSCKAEVPKVNALVEKYSSQGMKFFSINIGANDSVRRATKYAKKIGMNYPIIFDEQQEITNQYRIMGVPTIIIADSKGTIQYWNHGVPNITDDVFRMLAGK